jgi:hypothetical protein
MKSILLTYLALLLSIVRLSAADAKELAATQKWQGSVETGEAPKNLPVAIVNAVDFAAIWKKCGRTDALPTIDWAKRFAVCQTTSGSRLNLGAQLDASGDAKILGMATMDFHPGFRYVIAVFPREGVKSVNGVKLP